jgi:hypothetical protein
MNRRAWRCWTHNSGRTIAELPCVQDANKVYYDAGRKRIYVPEGEGYISVFQQTDPDHYQLLPKVPSTLGLAPPATLAKGGTGLTVSFSACLRADHGAEIWIYTVQD